MDMREPVSFELPKKPRIKQKDAPPDQRKLSVIPIRAGTDERLHGATLRCLIVLCSYCNRAGLTWVSQKKLAEDLKISRQAITKQFKLLTDTGYVEVVRKGFRGERSNTIRVIFDETVDTDTAIAVTSSIEDTRPPVIKEQQMQEEKEEIDRAGQARIAQMIAKGLRQVNQPKEKTMPKEGDTLAVKKMKADIEKAKSKRTHKQPAEVANGTVQEVANEALHRQPDRQLPEVAQNAEGTVLREVYKGNSIKENLIKDKSLMTVLRNQGLNDHDIEQGLEIMLAAYAAEGLTPKPQHLVDGLLQMHRDAR